MYLGGIITEVGRSEAEGTISKTLKGKVPRACATVAGLYGRETVALTEQQLQQQKLQVCENNRITIGNKRMGMRMKDLWEETGMQFSSTGRIVTGWCGQVTCGAVGERPTTSQRELQLRRNDQAAGKQTTKLLLRREVCVKRELRKAEEDQKWNKKL